MFEHELLKRYHFLSYGRDSQPEMILSLCPARMFDSIWKHVRVGVAMTGEGGGCCGHLAGGDQGRCESLYGAQTNPTTKSDLVQNVDSAMVEKL